MPARISLTISGAIALGAYEGGALAALLYAVRPLAAGPDPAVVIDVMSGASAGSITALLAARTLQRGHDPAAVMAGAWVEQASLGRLLGRGAAAPLSIDALRRLGQQLLDPPGEPAADRQAEPIRLSYTLATLRGLEYRLARLGRDPVPAVTYVDYFDHVLDPETPTAQLTGPGGAPHDAKWPLDAALASAANALGFPPYLLDRAAQWPDYRAQGVDNLPPDEDLWFTDGGTLDNEPLGRTLDLTNAADETDGTASRLHLLVHPHPTAATSGTHWANPVIQPTFLQTALRALSLQRTQSIYHDLKQAEKTNSHIEWLASLADHLGPELDALPEDSRGRVRAALATALAEIGSAHTKIDADADRAAGSTRIIASASSALPSALLSRALHDASGTGGKRPARIDVISPLLLPEVRSGECSVEQMLSGEILGHFGGFFDETLRRNDFDLGYASTLQWLEAGGLDGLGLTALQIETALDSARGAYLPGDGWKQTGETTVGSLFRKHPWLAVRLALKIGRVLLHDLLHHRKP
jgi:predicted acylesterase/phospholipase RssA